MKTKKKHNQILSCALLFDFFFFMSACNFFRALMGMLPYLCASRARTSIPGHRVMSGQHGVLVGMIS